MTPASLYVHAPFCARRCSYCDFAVTVDSTPPVEAWLDTIEAELAHHVAAGGWERLRLETLYVGGGTPSLLGAGAMAGLRDRLRAHADCDAGSLEWTAEANPERFDDALATDWARAGVTRVSLGAQTFDEATLRWMGRLHGPDGPVRAVRAARAAGIPAVSVDLIFGLPARHTRDWAADLDRTVELEPEHVSLYGLTAEPATPLGRWVAEGREHMPADEAYEAEYLLAVDRLTAAGYEHYEVSNFARPGHASRHNQAYWTGAAYLGLGPGAHTYLPPRRWWNVRDWAAYRERVRAGGEAVESAETPDGGALRLELAWLGLRTKSGLAMADATPAQSRLADAWSARGWAERFVTGGGERIRLTGAGWLLLDRLAVEWDAAPEAADREARRAGPARR